MHWTLLKGLETLTISTVVKTASTSPYKFHQFVADKELFVGTEHKKDGCAPVHLQHSIKNSASPR